MGGKAPLDNRKALAFTLPGLLAGLYTLSTSESAIVDRLLNAVLSGFAVTVIGYVLPGVAVAAAELLIGEGTEPGQEPQQVWPLSARDTLAGILLVSGIWLWWQHNKNTTMNRVAVCVGSVVTEQHLTPERAVLECYAHGTDDEWNEPE
jgi:xanthine/uracil permease